MVGDLLVAALCGEIGIHDDDLLFILAAQRCLVRAKQLCVGLKTAHLIDDEQAELAFHALPMREV